MLAAHIRFFVAAGSRPAASAGQACTAQNGAHWWAPVGPIVPTWTQHWVSRSSIMVLTSMKGLTVTRKTLSPSNFRSR